MKKRMAVKSAQGRGFTLIELLVVILIIAVLLAMLFPAITALRRAALTRKATTQAQAIANAVKQYYVAYNIWPAQTQGASDTIYDGANQASVIAALTNNPRGVLFLEIASDSIMNGCYMDPWLHPYVIAMDENDNGHADMNSGKYSPSMTMSASGTVAVASWGRDPDDPDATPAELQGRRVYAWMQ